MGEDQERNAEGVQTTTAGAGKASSASGIEESLERAMQMIQPMATSNAAPQAVLLTLTVASLIPVIQATMSFMLAASESFHQSHAHTAELNANALPLLARSANQILSAPSSPPDTATFARSTTREATYVNPNQLAVT